MAAKTQEDTAPSSEQKLTCPLCLDIFDEPTLLTSCQHTFCRKCLKKYDLSHQDFDGMVCPVCRRITKLSSNRVDDLPINVTFNELVDDYHAKCGGVNAVLEKRPKCTACKRHQDAVSFCRTCNNKICDKCLDCHCYLICFEDHEVVSIKDITEGNVSTGHPPEKCSIHKQENKEMFCEGCKIHVCFKCVVMSHRDHKIKSHEDFKMELQAEVNDLVQRCAAKKSELEENIQNMITQGVEVRNALEKLRQDVSKAYSVKAKQLEENQRRLVEQIDALEHSFDDDLHVLKSKDRQKIKNICSSMTLVANDRLGGLETDSLSAHILLCEELRDMLKEVTDHTSAAAITKEAQKKKFKPADDTLLDLGKITEPDFKPPQGATVKEATESDESSAAFIREKAEKKFLPADDTRLDLGKITEPNLEPAQSAMVKEATKSDHNSEAFIREKAEKNFKNADDTRLDLGKITEPDLKPAQVGTVNESTESDQGSVAVIGEKAGKKFKPADDTRLNLGTITEPDLKPAQGAMVKESTESDHSSVAVIGEKAEKKFKPPAHDTRLDPGSISSDPELQVIHCVDLKRGMWGMTKYSDDSVAIGYGGNAHGIDIIDSAGNKQQYTHIPSDMNCYDLVFQQDRSLCVSTGNTKEAYIYSPNGSRKRTLIQVIRTGCYPRLNRCPSGDIIVTNRGSEVYIYDPTGTILKRTVPHPSTMQASATKAGLIISSTCYIKPSLVTLCDRNGVIGTLLLAPKDVYLYAAVDEQDRVYIASVDRENGKVVISLCDIDGLSLKEKAKFNALHLTLEGSWCYFVSLSEDLLAFACEEKLYFIKVSRYHH